MSQQARLRDLGVAEACLLSRVLFTQEGNSCSDLVCAQYVEAVMNAFQPCNELHGLVSGATEARCTSGRLCEPPRFVGLSVTLFPTRSLLEVVVRLERFREKERQRWESDRARLSTEFELLRKTVQRTIESTPPPQKAESHQADALYRENVTLRQKLREFEDRCHQLEEQEALARDSERKLQQELLEIVQAANSREQALEKRQEELRKIADENRHRFEAMQGQIQHFESITEKVQKKLDQAKQSEQEWRQQAQRHVETLNTVKIQHEEQMRAQQAVTKQWQRGLKGVARTLFSFTRGWERQCAELECGVAAKCRSLEQRLSQTLLHAAACAHRFAQAQATGQKRAHSQAERLYARIHELEGHEAAMKQEIQRNERRANQLERELRRLEQSKLQLVHELAEVRSAWETATKRERELHEQCERSQKELGLKEQALKEIQQALESKENTAAELCERICALEDRLLTRHEEHLRQGQRSASKTQPGREDSIRKRLLQEAQEFNTKLKQAAEAQAELRSNLDARTASTPSSATRSLASSPLS